MENLLCGFGYAIGGILDLSRFPRIDLQKSNGSRSFCHDGGAWWRLTFPDNAALCRRRLLRRLADHPDLQDVRPAS